MESKTLPVSYDEIMACQILKTHIGNSNLSTYIKQVAEDFGYTKFLWDTINELGQPLQEEFDIITDTDNQQYLYHISIVSMLNLAEEVVRERIAREKAEKGEIIFVEV